MHRLRRLFYVSRTRPGLNISQIKDIVLRAQRANRQLDVTGMLAHSGAHFAQVLEGTAEHLATLVDKIRRDLRHTDIKVMQDEAIHQRDYAQWSMGFVYDPSLIDELEHLLSTSDAAPHGTVNDSLRRRIFLHVSDPANP